MSQKYFCRLSKSGPILRCMIFDPRAALCNPISVGKPPLVPLRNTSPEVGALPSEVRIDNDSDRKFSKSKFLKVFLETTFVQAIHYRYKIVYRDKQIMIQSLDKTYNVSAEGKSQHFFQLSQKLIFNLITVYQQSSFLLKILEHQFNSPENN